MSDLGRRNRTFQETLCGGPSGSDSGNSDNGNGSSSNSGGVAGGGGLGLLAGACGLSNNTFMEGFDSNALYLGMQRMLGFFGESTNSSKEDDDKTKPKQCSQLNYNISNQPGQ